MNTGEWSSWTAAGDRAVMRGNNYQPSGSLGSTDVLVDASGATQPFVSPIPGYTAGRISGDGRSTLLWQDTGAGGQSAGFAVVGPSGTQFVAAPTGWTNAAVALSYNGGVAGGISSPPGPDSASGTHALRWTGGPTAGGPNPASALPAGMRFGVVAGLSGDGSTIFGGLFDSNFALHPYLFSDSGGFDLLTAATPDAFVSAVSFDGSLALVGGSLGVDSLMWQRGLGEVPMPQYLAAHGVDLSGFADVHFFDMSYDCRTLLAEGAQDGVYVPLLITVPGPGPITLLALFSVFKLARPKSRPISARRVGPKH
jgi:hypothetical protein